MQDVIKRGRVTATVAFFGLLALSAGQAWADAALLGAVPAPDARVASPQMVLVKFSEGIVKNLSTVKLTDSDGHAVATMQMPTADPKELAVMPDASLAPGEYTVTWTVVSGNGSHKGQGSYHFTVK